MKYETFAKLSPELKEEYNFLVRDYKPIIDRNIILPGAMFVLLQFMTLFILLMINTHPALVHMKNESARLFNISIWWNQLVVLSLLAITITYFIYAIIYAIKLGKFNKKVKSYLEGLK